jgi:hypothetical protein
VYQTQDSMYLPAEASPRPRVVAVMLKISFVVLSVDLFSSGLRERKLDWDMSIFQGTSKPSNALRHVRPTEKNKSLCVQYMSKARQLCFERGRDDGTHLGFFYSVTST